MINGIMFRFWDDEIKRMIPWKEIKSINKLDYIIHPNSMQFTELFDRNNKPIYAGDIVQHRRDDNSICICPYEVKFGINESYDMTIAGWNIDLQDGDAEIIGNIWENTDILKRQK